MMNNNAIVDGRMSEKCINSLINLGFNVVRITPFSLFDSAICCHPDMRIFKHKFGMVYDSSLNREFCELMFDIDSNIKTYNGFDENNSKIRYPDDCIYNFSAVGEYVIGNFKIKNDCILDVINKNSYKKINVSQGYAKCNICIVSDNAIITEDTGISNECLKNGIDVLLLDNNEVLLDGYKNGFIGGASGNVNNILYFCGDITKHSSYKLIEKFCNSHNTGIISLSDEPLYDYGSIIFV